MADIGQLVVVVFLTDEVDNIETIVAAVCDISGVAFHAGFIGNPFTDCSRNTCSSVVFGQGSIFVSIGFSFMLMCIFSNLLDESLLVAVGSFSHSLCGFFCSSQSFGCDSCFFTFALCIDMQVVCAIGVAVKVCSVFSVVCVQLFIGVGESGVDAGGIFLCNIVDGQELFIVLGVAAAAILSSQQRIAGRETIHGSHSIQHGQLGRNGVLGFFAQSEVVGNCLIINGIGAGSGADSIVQQIVSPSAAIFHQGVSHVAQQVGHGIPCVGVVIVDHSRGQLMTVSNSCGGVGLEVAAIDHGKEYDDSNKDHCGQYAQCSLETLAHTFFGFCSRSLVGQCLFLTHFLFAGCAHVVVHSSHTSVFAEAIPTNYSEV